MVNDETHTRKDRRPPATFLFSCARQDPLSPIPRTRHPNRISHLET